MAKEKQQEDRDIRDFKCQEINMINMEWGLRSMGPGGGEESHFFDGLGHEANSLDLGDSPSETNAESSHSEHSCTCDACCQVTACFIYVVSCYFHGFAICVHLLGKADNHTSQRN